VSGAHAALSCKPRRTPPPISAARVAHRAAAGIRSVVLLPKGKIPMAQLVQPVSTGFDGWMTSFRSLRWSRIYLANSMKHRGTEDNSC